MGEPKWFMSTPLALQRPSGIENRAPWPVSEELKRVPDLLKAGAEKAPSISGLIGKYGEGSSNRGGVMV